MEESLYDQIAHEGVRLPSEMAIFPSGDNFVFSRENIEASLRSPTHFDLIRFEVLALEDEAEEMVTQKYEIEIRYQGNDYVFGLSVVNSELIDLEHYGLGNTISDQEMEQAQNQSYFLECSHYFSSDALASYHIQLKVMQAIVSKPSLVLDYMLLRMLSGKWVEVTAQSKIPPAPSYLIAIHAIYDDTTDIPTHYWMHTHGLHRCGSVELEMLNINNGVYELYNALNVVAGMFLYPSRQVLENEEFEIGYDGLGLSFAWKRWEDVLDQFPEGIPGGLRERNPQDGDYGPSGVLFAVQDDLLTSPEVYASTLANNPIYFISDEETERMSALAYDRLGDFVRVFKERYDTTVDIEQNEWSFLMKLGLPVDGGNGKEHLWFRVLEMDGSNTIVGKLVNQPYWIEKLHEGDINSYDLHLITDWIIYSPDTNFTPDNVYAYDLA